MAIFTHLGDVGLINLAPLAGFEAKCEFLKFKVSSGAYHRAETHFIKP